MLYVSWTTGEEGARQQIEQMTTRIRVGNGPFTHLRKSARFGLPVYSVLGQGQVHYYFRTGASVVWLAAEAAIARSALADAAIKLHG